MHTHQTQNKLRNTFIAILVGVTTIQSAGAQQGPAIAAPSNSWSFTDHASTYGEGIMRGQASVLGAVGELAYLDSLASVNYQEAQRRAIENSVAFTKAYFDRRALREEFIEKYGRKPLVGEERRKAMEYYRPKKLSAEQFHSQSGKIVWPHILRQAQYTPVREEIDSLFVSRTHENSGNGSETQLQIKKLVKTLAALLRENLHAMSADQYIESQEFLRSVDSEAKNPIPPASDNLGLDEATPVS